MGLVNTSLGFWMESQKYVCSYVFEAGSAAVPWSNCARHRQPLRTPSFGKAYGSLSCSSRLETLRRLFQSSLFPPTFPSDWCTSSGSHRGSWVLLISRCLTFWVSTPFFPRHEGLELGNSPIADNNERLRKAMKMRFCGWNTERLISESTIWCKNDEVHTEWIGRAPNVTSTTSPSCMQLAQKGYPRTFLGSNSYCCRFALPSNHSHDPIDKRTCKVRNSAHTITVTVTMQYYVYCASTSHNSELTVIIVDTCWEFAGNVLWTQTPTVWYCTCTNVEETLQNTGIAKKKKGEWH